MTGKSMKRMLGRYLVGLGMAFSGALVSFSSAHSETLNISSFDELDKYFANRNYEVEKWIDGSQKIPPIVILDIPDSWRKEVAPSLTVENKKRLSSDSQFRWPLSETVSFRGIVKNLLD